MENKNIKTHIDCYLELYQTELNLLQEKTLALYEDFSSKPVCYWSKNPDEFFNLNKKISQIESHKEALRECKNESIANI